MAAGSDSDSDSSSSGSGSGSGSNSSSSGSGSDSDSDSDGGGKKAQAAAVHLYRKSKLTMALKPCFLWPGSQTVIIATVSPASKDTEHSLNTLRHACIMNGDGKVR